MKFDFSRGGKVGGGPFSGNSLDLNSLISSILKNSLLTPQTGGSGGKPSAFGTPMAGGRTEQKAGPGGGFQVSYPSNGGKAMPFQMSSSGGPPPSWVMTPMRSGGSAGSLQPGLNNQQRPVPIKTTTTTTQAPASNNDEAAEEIFDDKK